MSNDDENNLITGPFPVSIGDRGESPRPDRALVFSLSTGEAELITRRPAPWEARRYRYRYVVDTSDKQLAWQDSLPSSVPGYSFRADLETAWRVSRAVEVVRRGITSIQKGDTVVRRGLAAALTSHTQKFDIENCAVAQDALNAEFGASDSHLPEGITVSGFTARLNLDADAEQYVRTRHRMGWDAILADLQAGNDMSAAKWKGQITGVYEDQIRAAAQHDGGLITWVMAQDPSQMRSVLSEIAAHQQLTLEQKRQLFRDLVDKKFVQPADWDAMWQTLFPQQQSFGVGPSLQELRQGPRPAPAGPPDANDAEHAGGA
jgi:hypothetical protein